MDADKQVCGRNPDSHYVEFAVEVFGMLADATRVRIILALRDAELSVNQLAELLDKTPVSVSVSVSQHLAKLRLALVVSTLQDGTRIFYRLANEHSSPARHRRHLPSRAQPQRLSSPSPPPRRRDHPVSTHHDQHEPAPHDHDHSHDHQHGHGVGAHSHPTGIRGFLLGLLVPHTHDASDSIDNALEASTQGVRALKISLFVLLETTVLQFLVFLMSGSVALLADTIHNFSDALTAVPLWIAFILSRRHATRRYTCGFGRAEDLAGLSIVVVVALSAVVAAWESISRLLNPQSLENLWFVAAGGLIAFVGNELVAVYRIGVGEKIGSAALVADEVPARLDGFTSLAVVLGAIGVMRGFPFADPIIGMIISGAIIVPLWETVKSIGRRLMDGIEPDLVDRARLALEATPGILALTRIQLRWVGHRLQGAAPLHVDDAPLPAIEGLLHDAGHSAEHALPPSSMTCTCGRSLPPHRTSTERRVDSVQSRTPALGAGSAAAARRVRRCDLGQLRERMRGAADHKIIATPVTPSRSPRVTT